MQMDLLALMAPPMRFEPVARVTYDSASREGWETYKAAQDAEIEATGIETLRWGKQHATPGYELDLWHSSAGWRFAVSYNFTNQGGGGPFGSNAYATREAAMVAAFREKLRSMARCVVSSWTSEGEKAQRRGLAAWMISHCPPLHFGGINLADEWEAMQVEEDRRERRRLIALRAAHDLAEQIEGIAKSLGIWSYSGSQCSGSLQGPGREATGDDSTEQRAAIWPARWSIGGHSPGALELHTYPATGQAASPTLQAFLSAVRAALPIPITEHPEGWRYPVASYTWDEHE